jgi:hypothetical protein
MYSQLKESVYNMTNKIMTQEKIIEILNSMYDETVEFEKQDGPHFSPYAFMCGSLKAKINILATRIKYDI